MRKILHATFILALMLSIFSTTAFAVFETKVTTLAYIGTGNISAKERDLASVPSSYQWRIYGPMGSSTTDNWMAVFKYDLSNLPAGEEILSANWEILTSTPTINTAFEFYRITGEGNITNFTVTYNTMPTYESTPFLKSNIVNGNTTQMNQGYKFIVDMTEEITAQRAAGVQNFGFVMAAVNGSAGNFMIPRSYSPNPQLVVTTTNYKGPTVKINARNVIENTDFTVTANVTAGDAEIKNVSFYINNELLSGVTQQGDIYSCNLIGGLVAGEYTIEVVVTDINGFIRTKETSINVVSFSENWSKASLGPYRLLNSYNGIVYDMNDYLIVDDSNFIAYFSYNLSGYENKGINSVKWICDSLNNNGISFYDLATPWTISMYNEGIIPDICEQPFYTANSLSDVDFTEHINALVDTGKMSFDFAVKASGSTAFTIPKDNNQCLQLSFDVSDNTRPIIAMVSPSNEYVIQNTEFDFQFVVTDNGLIEDVSVVLDDSFVIDVINLNDTYSSVIPALTQGTHVVSITATDNSGSKTVKDILLSAQDYTVYNSTIDKNDDNDDNTVITVSADMKIYGMVDVTTILCIYDQSGKMIACDLKQHPSLHSHGIIIHSMSLENIKNLDGYTVRAYVGNEQKNAKVLAVKTYEGKAI